MNDSAPSGVRDRILRTAGRLFYADGVRAVGVDRLIAESGVAKRTFYRHFPSKTSLVVAWLCERHGEWMTRFISDCEEQLEGARRGAGLGILADGLAAWFRRPGYRGCAFINVVAESGTAPDPDVREVAIRHKEELQRWVVGLATRLGIARPATAARRAMILVEGMIVRYQMTGDPAVAADGRRMLTALSESGRRRGVRRRAPTSPGGP